MADRLEQNFAALAAERDALRRFVADASHELRTPITALKNFNDLLQGAAAHDSTARAEFLIESQTQINRLEWITRHLLDLSRLDAGLITLDRSIQDVGDLIEAAASPFKSIAAARAQTLSIERPADPIALDCDRTWIELALANLLDNAVKFTPPGGRIRLGARQSGNSVQLWLTDDGPGIDPIDQPHLFDRFYRGHVVGHQPGSGLGLSIVRSVAYVHGGRVDVVSSASGSTFTLELPLTPQT
jgi:signal transduction histidine kinase